ncbi:hypothetical protein HN51_015705, partial [Arachis hypogaea]
DLSPRSLRSLDPPFLLLSRRNDLIAHCRHRRSRSRNRLPTPPAACLINHYFMVYI